MKRTFKKGISVFLVVAMLLCAAPLNGFVGMEFPDGDGFKNIVEKITSIFEGFSTKVQAATYSGKCGDNLTWTLDTETGVLNITGTGKMKNYYNEGPWYSYRSYIKSVVISYGITSIGSYAFMLCSNIENVQIPDTVEFIYDSAFTNCDALTTVVIPRSVTTIGSAVFAGCNNLSSISVDENNSNYSNDEYGVLFDKDKTKLLQYTAGNLRENYTIPSTVTEIGSYAFADCEILTDIIIPFGVTIIGYWAFASCSNLANITIPNSVVSIESFAFGDCSGLTNIIIPNSVKSIGSSVFSSCTNLTSITISDGISTIEEFMFQYCSNLTSVFIPKSVKVIDDRAFDSCATLSEVFFSGDEIEWNKIKIGNYNTCLTGATIHFNYVHTHSYRTTVTDPTCTKHGYITYTCDECGDIYNDDYIDALGHLYSKSDVQKPTCTAQGYTKYTCARSGCGDSYIGDYTSAIGHSYGDWIETPATCEETGSRYKVCSICSHKVNESIPALGHDYNSVETLPTCKEEGYTTHTCKNCNESKKDTYVPALGHTYGDWIDEIEATCESSGLRYRKCSCGDRIEETISSLGHSYEKVSVTPPTHEKDGYTKYACNNCGKSKISDFVAAIGHTYGMWTTEKVATCTQEGLRVRVCSCGDRIEEIIEKISHTYTPKTTPATCTEKGYTIFTCSVCQHSYTDETVDALGHSYGDWTTKKTATCSQEGLISKTCSVCSDKIEETVPKTEHKYTPKTTAPSCTESGYTTHTCSVCQHSYTDATVDALGHSYSDWITEKEASCSSLGSEYMICSVCNDKIDRDIPIKEHIFKSYDTKPTCVNKGFTTHTCTECEYSYSDSYVDASGHVFGDWQVDKESTLLENGLHHRNCTVCDEVETESIPKIEVDIEANTNYGVAEFTVVHAQNLTPISGAQIFISTENDGENTFVTDKDGKISVVLPVGKQRIAVYAQNYMTRNLNITVKSGINELPVIGLSDKPVYDAKVESHEMTLEEIQEVGIDTTDPANKHVYKYELRLDFIPGADISSIFTYFNDGGTYLGGSVGDVDYDYGEGEGKSTYYLHYHENPTKSCYNGLCRLVEVEKGQSYYLNYRPERTDKKYTFNGWYEDTSLTKKTNSVKIDDYNTFVYGQWLYDGEPEESKPSTSGIKIKEDDEVITIYPVSEYFYLIIRGEVSWLKEMFDVEMLVINNSMTDKLENVKATLTLPEGLSLAAMVGENQNLEQYIGTVPEGETKSVHWYVKGDKEGNYNLEAHLEGMIMPWEEPIDDKFVCQNGIQVYAGNALNLHFEFPNAAYYGDDYPITITLTNVSDKTLYNINHKVQIVQGMEIYYSDGSSKKRIETSEWKSIGVEKFNPGDKLIIQASVNIFFESEILQSQIEKYIGLVDGVEQLIKSYKAVTAGYKAFDKLFKNIDKCGTAINKFLKSSAVTQSNKAELLKQLYSKISDLYSSYNKSGNKTFDAIFGLANSGVNTTLNVITNDPEAWLDKCAEKDIKSLIKKISALETVLSSDNTETKKFDIFDSIRTAISAIPVVFTLAGVTMTEDGANTTSIPWSYSVSNAAPRYFGVSSVSKYLMSLIQMMAGELYDENIPGILQLLSGVDDPFNTDEALEYIKATEKEIAQFKAKDATGNVKFKAWVEKNKTSRSTSISDDFILSTNNKTAKLENGILTFTGDGIISVVPQNTEGGTLHIEDSEGNVYTYVIDVVKAHTCEAGNQQVIISPTGEYDGFAVKCCETCEEILEVINLTTDDCCTEHSFGSWETETEATCSSDGVKVRTCSLCGFIEYDFTTKTGHSTTSHKVTSEPTCTENGTIIYYCSCGESYSEVLWATGHTFDNWVTQIEATCKNDGLKTATCTMCKEAVEEVIPKIGHKDSDIDGKCDVCTKDLEIPPAEENDENVNPILKSISVSSLPEKTRYYIGESLATTGLKLKLTYSDGSSEIISNGFAVSDFRSATSGKKTVTVYYNGFKTTFEVIVDAVSIKIIGEDNSMFIDETVELSAITTVEGSVVIWSTSDEKIATVKDGIVIAIAEGNAVITASITIDGKTYSANYTVTVSNPKGIITDIVIVGSALKTDYYVGDPLNTSGLQLEVTYADGSKEIISSGFATNGFDSNNEGSKIVVVEYGNHTVKYDITVKSAEERKSVDSGTCGAQGDNLTWTFYENGQLVIDGTGDMKDYEFNAFAPWKKYSESIVEVTISDYVTNIGNYSFYFCNHLTYVKFPDSVKVIGECAFSCCYDLMSITIPDSVTTIGHSAFSDCNRLIDVTIPDNVINLGSSAFSGCDTLDCIIIGNGLLSISDEAFFGCKSLTSVNISDNVTSIGYRAFYGCNSLTSITIPEGLTNIDDCAFYFCTSLESISFPNSITTIGNSAFYGCSSLTSIIIPDNVTVIKDNVFYSCSNLTSIIIPNSVTSIGYDAFGNCDSLKSVTIPNSVTAIGQYAFYSCDSLTSVTIPDSVTTIEHAAFCDCDSLTNITVSKNNPNYLSDEYGVLFNKDKTMLVQYPCGNTLTNYIIPDSVTTIYSSSFYSCNNLTSVTIPDSVTYIKFRAFGSCDNITDINFTGTNENWEVINIASNNECLASANIHYNYVPLKSISINTLPNKTLYYVGDTLDISGLTLNVTSYYSGKTEIVSEGFNCLPTTFDTAGTQRVTVTYGDKNVVFEVTVKEIPADAVLYSGVCGVDGNNLTWSIRKDGKLIIAGVGDMKDFDTFGDSPWNDYVHNVLSIDIQEGVTSIGDYAFVNCINVIEVNISNTVTSIGTYSFEDCWSFSKLILPKSINIIADNAFCSCGSLTDIYVYNSNVLIGDNALNCKFRNATIYGYPGSTAEEHANLYNRNFIAILLDDICVSREPNKVNYHVGDLLDTTGLILSLTYNTGKTETINEGFTCIPTILHTAGIHNIQVVYGGKTTYFNVMVKELPGDTNIGCEFEAVNGAFVDTNANFIYGLDAGLTSLDDYTNILSTGSFWQYIETVNGFGTGTKAMLKNSDETVAEYTIVIFGDIQGDGWYDGEDAFLVNLIVNGMLDRDDVGEAIWTAADCNHDGVIDEWDVDLLIGAGLLLNKVDQSATPAELALNSDYIEYAMLIDQSAGMSVEPDVDNSQQGTTDTNTTPEQPADEINIEAIFTFIFDLIKTLVNFIFSFVIK